MKLKSMALFSALLALSLLAAAPGSRAGELSESDNKMVQDCIKNVKLPDGVLSPVKSDECIDQFNAGGSELMDKASADFPDLAVQAMSRNNALSDLRDIITRYEGVAMANGLIRVVENRDVLPQMKLGPKPEALNEWVAKYVPGREAHFKKAIRTWSSLGEIRTKSLTGYNESSWAAMNIDNRYETLYNWACGRTDELIAAAGMAAKNKEAVTEYAGLVAVLKEDLAARRDWKRIQALNDMMKVMGAAAAAPPAGPTAADKKGGDLDKAAKGLQDAKAGDATGAYLGQTFDNSKSGGDAAAAAVLGKDGKKFTPVPITDPQAATLGTKMGTVKDGKFTGYLADDMRGTKAGDEVIAFLEDPAHAKTGANTLNLKFEKGEGDLADAMGWYSSDDKVTRVNTSLVDKFCAGRKITPEQLLKDEGAMRDLAAYVNPTFLHETVHQRQDAWSASKDLKFLTYRDPASGKVQKFSPYEMEMEAEAFGMNGSFVAEKAKKGGTAYLKKLHWSDQADAERYLEDGVDGLRTQYHGSSYTQIDSLKGAAASNLNDAQATALRVDYLAKKSQQKDAAMTDEEKAELKAGRTALDTRFKWYKETLAKSKADEKKLLAWRTEVDPEGNVLTTVKTLMALPGGGE